MIVTINFEYLLYFVFGLAMIYPLYCLYTMFKPKPLSQFGWKILKFLEDKDSWKKDGDNITYAYKFLDRSGKENHETLVINPSTKQIKISLSSGYESFITINTLLHKKEEKLVLKKANAIFKKLAYIAKASSLRSEKDYALSNINGLLNGEMCS